MKVGDIVVCIDDTFHSEISKCFKSLPVKGKKYTIRTIRPIAAEGGILLEEVKNPSIFFKLYQGNLEPAFHPRRFRPIQPISNKQVEEYEYSERESLELA